MFLNDIVDALTVKEAKAIKQRLDAKCWTGKHKEGTKIKGGVRVNNCVPNESVEEAANAAQQAAIAINMKKQHKKPKSEGVAEGQRWPDDSNSLSKRYNDRDIELMNPKDADVNWNDRKIATKIKPSITKTTVDRLDRDTTVPNFLKKKTEEDSTESQLEEKWSQKYKRSINCSHPKGFSQKAHCAGKKKHNESHEVMEMTCPDCGMCETHGTLTELKKGQKDANGYTRCWPGKHAEGTKKGKNGGQVRNCVPNENVTESQVDEILGFQTAKPVAKKSTTSLSQMRKEFEKEPVAPQPKVVQSRDADEKKAREVHKQYAEEDAGGWPFKDGVDEDSWSDGQGQWTSQHDQWAHESLNEYPATASVPADSTSAIPGSPGLNESQQQRLERLEIQWRLQEMKAAGYDL